MEYGGGDLEIKNIQNKFIFFVLFHVKDIEDTVYGMQCFKWYACQRCLSEPKFSRALHILENNSTL